MLGHSEKPTDWETLYGPAPYTSANDVLWTAIATEPGRYGKPDIKSYLPVDASGNLLDPLAAGLVDNFDIPGRQDFMEIWRLGSGRNVMEEVQCFSFHDNEDTCTYKTGQISFMPT